MLPACISLLTAVLPDLNLIPSLFIYIAAGLLGAIIGSFLNVVIHRLPLEESIVLPSSRCPSCGAAIAFYDNVPVLSYIVLGGRCRSCKTHISARYPAVEALTAAAVAGSLLARWSERALPFDLVFVTAIVALIFIDAEHMILPNAITYPGIVFALWRASQFPYLMGRPHFDDLPMLMNWSTRRNAAVGGFAGRRSHRRVNWRRLAVVNGMDLGKTPWHRSDGTG